MFLNLEGRQFDDVTMISGADHLGDGRSVVLLDFDRDGWTDIASVNTNAPKLVMFRNAMKDAVSGAKQNHFVALRFVGGNETSNASKEFSNRDGYGVRVVLTCGERGFVEEYRCGEGFSAQNSRTLLIGLGDSKAIEKLTLRWPSGKVQTMTDLPVDRLLTVRENAGPSPQKSEIRIEPYRAEVKLAAAFKPAGEATFNPADAEPSSKLRLFTTMATWCAACAQELPRLAHLHERFPRDQLGMFGLPGDEKETPEQLAKYVGEKSPPYQLIAVISPRVRASMNEVLGADAATLPASIVTDGLGRVVLTTSGVPTASQIAKLLDESG